MHGNGGGREGWRRRRDDGLAIKHVMARMSLSVNSLMHRVAASEVLFEHMGVA